MQAFMGTNKRMPLPVGFWLVGMCPCLGCTLSTRETDWLFGIDYYKTIGEVDS